MRKLILGLVIAFVFLSVDLFIYNAYAAANTQLAPAPMVQFKAASSSLVSAEGTVVPVTHTTLAFKTGGRIVEIVAHEGDTAKAGAVLARLDDTTLKAQVAQAEAALSVAQRQRAQLRAGATPAERQAAQDALAAARAAYIQVQAGPTQVRLAQLKANLDNAQAAVAQAQFRYDRIGGDSNSFGGAAPERLALQQATNTFLAAQAAYGEAVNHPTASELKAAESAITQAESAVARLDPTPEQLALAEAQIAQAQATLDLIKASVQEVVLTAPFDGTVVERQVEVGQVASPGVPAFTFADLSKLQVETTDLAEVDVAKLAVGQSANLKFDAFEGQTFTGKVARIAQLANDHRGDKVYRVTIDLADDTAAGLRWGMTANVEITVAR